MSHTERLIQTPGPAPSVPLQAGGLRVGVTTVPDQATARRLAQEAVRLGLAACVQIEAIESVYVWEGQVAQDVEWRLSFKCPPGSLDALTDWLHRAHPYELPQWYVGEPGAVSERYARWVQAGCEAGAAGRAEPEQVDEPLEPPPRSDVP